MRTLAPPMDAVTQPAAPAWRCLLVWSVASVLLASGTVLGIESAGVLLEGGRGRPFDLLVVDLAGALAAVVCPWLWVLTSAGVADALRGRVGSQRGWWRRATLVACGCAVTAVVSTTAHATTAADPRHDSGPAGSLHGLPYPDRPATGVDLGEDSSVSPASAAPSPTQLRTPRQAPAHGGNDGKPAPAGVDGGDRQPTAGDMHVVRAGDTLWAIARSHLVATRAAPTDLKVSRTVAALHDTNHLVLGDDPDLILPGQRLALDLPDSHHREDAR